MRIEERKRKGEKWGGKGGEKREDNKRRENKARRTVGAEKGKE